MNWIVTIHYDPGTPREYHVAGAHSSAEAMDAVLHHLGYHPGVAISATQLKGEPIPPVLYWHPRASLEAL